MNTVYFFLNLNRWSKVATKTTGRFVTYTGDLYVVMGQHPLVTPCINGFNIHIQHVQYTGDLFVVMGQHPLVTPCINDFNIHIQHVQHEILSCVKL